MSKAPSVPLYASDEEDEMGIGGATDQMDEMDLEEGDYDAVEGDVTMTPHDGNIPSTPKAPRKSMATRTPRPIPKSAFKSSKKDKSKKKKKKPRKSHLDISALTDEQVALAALQSSQILHLKLRKRYYAEALNFIRQIDGAMEIIGQLLGSTNKPEVLESIEFFRVAHEYHFVGAEVSVGSGFLSQVH